MDTVVVIIVSITLLAILGSIYLEVRRQIKPRIKVYFPDGSTRASYRAKEETKIAIHFQNTGRFGLPKPAATGMMLSVYAPTSFLLKGLEHLGITATDVREAPSGGIFAGMHYLHTETSFILFDKEEEEITVLAQMPAKTGKYTIKVPVTSKQGDLGIHGLKITVY